MTTKFLTLLFVCLCAVSATAQKLNTPKLDSFFQTIDANNKGMGSVAISKNGRLLYTRTIGIADNEDKKINSNTETKYRIGSISKMFTATMIFQLIEEHKLSLTTTLDQYYPQITNASKITIGNLLGHRSGLHSFTDDSDYYAWNTMPKTENELLDKMSKAKTEFEPDQKAEYSNTNYVLLGYILEKICKKPYKDILSERITSKIGLKNTYYGGKISVTNNEAYSFSYEDGWIKEAETDMSIPGGAGAIVSTPSDLVIFIQALFNKKLVNDSSLKLMKTIKDHYGMGMFQYPFGSKKTYGHTGGIDGFTSMVSWFPEDSVAVAYCSNGHVISVNDVLIGVMSIYFDKPFTIPTFKTVFVDSADLKKYVGTYITNQQIAIPPITITRVKNSLMAQGQGQSSFPLEAVGKNVFKFDAAHIIIEFYPDKDEMVLKQGGGQYILVRQK